MRIRILLACLSITSLMLAEDAPKAPRKKEILPVIPHVWVSEGLLCLHAKENYLCFANQSQDISSVNFTNTSLIRPHFTWSTGIQIDVGFQPKQQYYFASWCYIENTAHGSKSTDTTEGFFPVLSMNNNLSAANFVTSANTRWKLNTQLADAGTIFPWKPANFFLLKTQAGVRIASLNQDLKTYYGGGIYNQGTDAITMHNNFLGIGPIVGINPNILLPEGFSLCGEFAGFGLLGRFSVKQKERYLAQTLLQQTHIMTRFRFGFDAKAYLSWQKDLLYKAIVLSAQLGWQWHDFFAQNRLPQNSFQLERGNDNLFLQGGFLSLCVAF